MQEEKEMLKEELKVYVELLKILSAFVIALGGGLATLILNLNSPLKVLMFTAGSLLEMAFILACLRLILEISSLIRRLKQ